MFFFIFLFFIIAPIIVFFAKGYRFDMESGIFVYSGSITIKSVPRDIQVFLNDKKRNGGKISYINGSYTMNGVRPGKYILRCEKEGYSSWEKNIEVHSGISTEFWNVILFPNEKKQKSLPHTDKEVKQFFLSPRDNQEIVFFSEEENKNLVYLLDAKNNNIEKIYETDEFDFLPPSEKENIEWSSDNKQIFIPLRDKNGNKNYVIAGIKGEKIENTLNLNDFFKNTNTKTTETDTETNDGDDNDDDLPKIENNQDSLGENVSFKKVRWMFNKNDELVVLTTDQKLYYLDLNNPEKKILIDEQVSSFDFAGNRIYYTQFPNNIVWEIKDNKIETKRQITSQSFPSEKETDFMELTVYDEYRIVIRNESNGNIFIFNEEKEKNEILTKKVNENIQGIQFSDDGKKLLYWTDLEIWFLMLRDWDVQPIRKKGDNTLITRFSAPVKNVQWLNNYENIIFSADNKLKSAEIDIRDHINISSILTSSSNFRNRDFFYNKQNQTLFLRTPEIINGKEVNILKSIVLIESPGIFGFGR
ncbi:MAG: PEGA domain-containing protein [Patescibacteria group bacterium]|jgi:hypothetical protein|nr:PEGA domain-containing protein [Patescibacteria group bacterium]